MSNTGRYAGGSGAAEEELNGLGRYPQGDKGDGYFGAHHGSRLCADGADIDLSEFHKDPLVFLRGIYAGIQAGGGFWQ